MTSQPRGYCLSMRILLWFDHDVYILIWSMGQRKGEYLCTSHVHCIPWLKWRLHNIQIKCARCFFSFLPSALLALFCRFRMLALFGAPLVLKRSWYLSVSVKESVQEKGSWFLSVSVEEFVQGKFSYSWWISSDIPFPRSIQSWSGPCNLVPTFWLLSA